MSRRAGAALTPSALRDLAARHGIRPRKSLGQHFLIDGALARRIAELAAVGPGDHVVEVGPGLGSLTVALAATGADVLAVEVDESLLPALHETVEGLDRVRVLRADAMGGAWQSHLVGPGPWTMVANLPYNVATPVVLRALHETPAVERFLVMVQREVGERLAALPGTPAFGGVSLRVAYFARARVVRRVARSVFWPEPNVDSVLVSLERRPPPVGADRERLFELIRVAFAERRKTMRNALVRFGLDAATAARVLASCGIETSARPETLGLEAFGCLVDAL